ncbi:MAG: hypothetical protein ACE5JU_03690 [Candidatus Binatia bacterium]
MQRGTNFVQLFYPRAIGVEIPSEYFLTIQGKKAYLQAHRHLDPVQVLDFSRSKIAEIEDDELIYELQSPIFSPIGPTASFHMGTSSVRSLDQLRALSKEEIPKRLSSMPCEWTGNMCAPNQRIYETRYYTELFLAHDVDDAEKLSDEEQQFYQSVLREFIKAYKSFSKDWNVRYPEDLKQFLYAKHCTVELTGEEVREPFEERVRATHELKLAPLQFAFPYGYAPTIYHDVSAITQRLTHFLSHGNSIPFEIELLDSAIEAMQYAHNFRYAVIESFMSVEIVITELLTQLKHKRGASKAKLEDLRDEVGMRYKLNIELPILLENITEGERRVIADIDWLRELRNDIVHRGKQVVTESDAKRAINSVLTLYNMLQKRGVTIV